ncbi:MAG TPA: hypothetical protein VNM40_03435 [Candidatus Paceibacterota bacterium]|nr:hypothetical protein [Candidatus Paceibacterota bacterium]
MPFLDPKQEYLFRDGGATAVRIGNIFRGDHARSAEAFRLLYAMPDATIMYYGDEIGMRNLPRDPAITDTRRFVRGEFDWQDAERQLQDPRSLFAETAAIIHAAYWPYPFGRERPPLDSLFTSPPPASGSPGGVGPSRP